MNPFRRLSRHLAAGFAHTVTTDPEDEPEDKPDTHWVDDERIATAWHEAGHAVVGIACGVAVRYISLRPRSGIAGHVIYGKRPPPTWRHAGASYLAGMAAEQWIFDDRPLLADAAHDDLVDTRLLARAALAVRDQRPPVGYEDEARMPRWRQAATAIDPAWTENDLAADMWRYAVDLVAEYRRAIEEVADRLLTSPRAIRGTEVRRVLEASARDHAPPPVELTEWWAPRHTRMTWRGYTPCRPPASPPAFLPPAPPIDTGRPRP